MSSHGQSPTTETLSIDAFIEARLREDEQIALAATQGKWEWGNEGTLGVFEDWAPCPHPGCRFPADSKSSRMTPTGHEHRYLAAPVAMAHGYDDPWIEVSAPDSAHIARHDPARVLREVARNRKILDGHRDRDDYYELPDESTGSCETCSSYCYERGCRRVVPWPCGYLRDLASIWSSHPDFRAEWTA